MPTNISYPLRFEEIAPEKMASLFTEILSNPDIKSKIERRNRELSSAQRLRAGSPEFNALAKRVCKTDEKLAVDIFAFMAKHCYAIPDKVEAISFQDLLARYVDYTKPGNKERVDHLAAGLDKLTFLADMLESIVIDIKSDMDALFGKEVQFLQFDAVISVLTQLRGFFNNTRSQSDGTDDSRNLYMEYADSINAFIEKRLKTYTERYRKICPQAKPIIRSKEEVMQALNEFFHTEFPADMTTKSMNGGYDADYMKLAMNLTPRQTQYLDAHVALPVNEPDNVRKYNRTLTEILFNKRKWKKW